MFDNKKIILDFLFLRIEHKVFLKNIFYLFSVIFLELF